MNSVLRAISLRRDRFQNRLELSLHLKSDSGTARSVGVELSKDNLATEPDKSGYYKRGPQSYELSGLAMKR